MKPKTKLRTWTVTLCQPLSNLGKVVELHADSVRTWTFPGRLHGSDIDEVRMLLTKAEAAALGSALLDAAFDD